MAEKEAKARIKINKMLEEAGWRLIDDTEELCVSGIYFRNETFISQHNSCYT